METMAIFSHVGNKYVFEFLSVYILGVLKRFAFIGLPDHFN